VQVRNLEKQKSEFLSGSFYRELAIVSLSFFLAAFAPFVGVIAFIFLPLPILYFYSKNGRARGLALLGLSILIFSFTLITVDLLETLPVFVLLSFSGVVMAEALKRNHSIEKIVLFPVAGSFILEVIFVLYQSFHMSKTPWHLISSYIESKIRLSISFYEYLNVSSEQIKFIKENMAGIVSSITMIFPAISLIGLIFIIWVNLLAGKKIFQKYGLYYPELGDLSSWKVPEKMIWFLIAAGAILLLPDERTEILGWNMLIVILFVYLLAGVAIVSFFLKKSGVSTGLRYLVYFLIFAQQIITCLVAAAGVIDLWADFRKLNKPMEHTVA
jgi:uncharacterized protein YybS (DUF2232 family)